MFKPVKRYLKKEKMTSKYLIINLLLKNRRIRWFAIGKRRAHDVTEGGEGVEMEENVDTRNTPWYIDVFVSNFNTRTKIA